MRWQFLILYWLVAGCNMNDFTAYSQLNKLRIFALQVSTPEVQISSLPATVSLTTFASDISGSGRSLQWVVVTCSALLATEDTCDGVADRIEVANQSFDPATDARSDSTPFQSPLYTGALPDITFTIPDSIAEGYSEQILSNGVSYLIDVTLTSGNDTTRAVTTVNVSQRTQVNTNPTIDTVTLDGTEVSTTPTVGGEVLVTSTAAESYEYVGSDGEVETRQEDMFVSYLSNVGAFSISKTSVGESTEFTYVDGLSVFVVVVRDGRGGVDVQIW